MGNKEQADRNVGWRKCGLIGKWQCVNKGEKTVESGWKWKWAGAGILLGKSLIFSKLAVMS